MIVDFEVSVIIPVYNAEKYLPKAVESAVCLDEVREVILIEDGSPDNALEVSLALERQYPKVKVFRHPNGENRGAGASRNLGLKVASCNFISFLDADDWFLPKRFENARQIFSSTSLDGIYEPIGTYFYNAEAFFFGKHLTKAEGEKIITFPKRKIDPNNLFYYLLSPRDGTFHLNGVTLKKSFVDKVGYFSIVENFLHEDMEYWVRCAYLGKLASPENPTVVAIRGVHSDNRISGRNFESKSLYWKILFRNLSGKPMKFKEKKLLYKKAILFNRKRKTSNSFKFYLGLYYDSLKFSINFFFPRTIKKNSSE